MYAFERYENDGLILWRVVKLNLAGNTESVIICGMPYLTAKGTAERLNERDTKETEVHGNV